MKEIIDYIPKKNRELFLSEFFKYYVDLPGLGAMPKQDLNALIIFLFDKYSDIKYPNFEISRIFKTEEGKIRNLKSLGLARYDERKTEELEDELLSLLSRSKYEIHSTNTYEIQFLIVDQILKNYFEKIVEDNSRALYHSRNKHQVVVSISNLLSVYELLLKQKYSGKELNDLLSSIDSNLRKELVKSSKLNEIPRSERNKSSMEILKDSISVGSSIVNIVDKTSLIQGVITLVNNLLK